MKKALAIVLAIMMIAAMLSGCASNDVPATSSSPEASASAEATTSPSEEPSSEASPSPEAAEYKGVLLMATTTSTDNTGLLDYLAPIFLYDTGWELQWTAVGSGTAIQMGKDGEVDILMVHSPASEIAFVEEGYGVERFEFMYNDFVIVGPADGSIAYNDDVIATFTQIFDDSLTFVSRGDNSGTNAKEIGIWGLAGIEDYEGNANYISAGAGMTDTIVMADEMNGYCLTDRGTWLTTMQNVDYGINLEIICEGDPNLFNQYGVIAVSPEMYPDVNNEASNAFIEWVCSENVQTLIGEFGVDVFGAPLFTPNAK